jgi:hypothetical protein
MVRGAAVLPYSLGKPQRIAVFAEGQDADDALAAGEGRSALQTLRAGWCCWCCWVVLVHVAAVPTGSH